jgi:hypothetical protein
LPRKSLFYTGSKTSFELTDPENKNNFQSLVDLTKKLLFEMKEMDEDIKKE